MHHTLHSDHHETRGHCLCPCVRGWLPDQQEQRCCASKAHAFEAALHSIDPASVLSSEGVVSKFLYNLHGDADGFLLDGAQVHLPQHLSEALTQAVQIGDRVSVQGLKRRGVDVLVALAITALKGNQTFDCAPEP